MSAPALIPRPTSVRNLERGASLSDGMSIAADPACAAVGDLFAGELEAATGWRVERAGPEASSLSGTVRLRLAPELGAGGSSALLGGASEGYRLRVSDGMIEVAGVTAAGVFYGTRTLRQLLPADLLRAAPPKPWGPVPLEGVEVVDAPRFGWRGMMFDVARHFFQKSFLFRLIDLASLHKLNVLHLHLTDDQGWRFEVERYPRLTEVGAWRRESPVGHYREGKKDATPHGGFYTRADLEEVVAYAARRFVTVVPEVDMPGHTQAMIAAYPELGNTGQPLEVLTNWGGSHHVLNMEESTAAFCAGVLEELMGIFPSPFIHIGGDECSTAEWEASERAAELCKERGLAGPQALQGWFTSQMAEAVAAKGRSLVCWEEVLDAGAPPGCVIAPWRAASALSVAKRAAASGHRVVMAPEPWVYFDWSYADDPAEPLAIRPSISVEKVYSLEPVPRGLESEFEEMIVGSQCQLWTEYVATREHAEYMFFPRACAFAEAVWSSGDRSWAEFEPRLAAHLARLDALGVNYRPLAGPTPGQARVWPS